MSAVSVRRIDVAFLPVRSLGVAGIVSIAGVRLSEV